jgi:hypothetical protein
VVQGVGPEFKPQYHKKKKKKKEKKRKIKILQANYSGMGEGVLPQHNSRA